VVIRIQIAQIGTFDTRESVKWISKQITIIMENERKRMKILHDIKRESCQKKDKRSRANMSHRAGKPIQGGRTHGHHQGRLL